MRQVQQETCFRKGYLLQGLRLDSCLTLTNELSKETHGLTEQKTLLGRGTWAESSRVRENCSATWFIVSCFMGMGLVSGVSLANHLAWLILCVVPSTLSVTMDSSAKDPGIWSSLPPVGSSQILPVSLQGSTIFLIKAF